MTSPEPPHPPAHAHTTHAHSHKRLLSRIGLGLVVTLLVGLVAFSVDFRRDLSFLRLTILTGVESGNYHTLGLRLADVVRKEGGSLQVATSEGSVDNVQKLVRAEKTCEVEVALVQDGTDWQGANLRLIGRLVRPETVFVLGKKSALTSLRELSHARIGMGPKGSGTARVASQLFERESLRELGLVLSHHEIDEQIELAAKGELDLVVMVIDEDAPVVASALSKGLDVVELPELDVLARSIPALSVGKIAKGQYDPVAVVPASARRVLHVETLVVVNRCASRSRIIGMMAALVRIQPDFVRYNRELPNHSGIPLAPAAKSFFEHDGPEPFDEYVPWLVDVMPPGNWAYVVMAVSLLFNAMGSGHRFRLWRIDAARVKAEGELARYFPPGTTLGDIGRVVPTEALLSKEVQTGLRAIVEELEALADKSRKDSLSMLVPMGQEMAYRYQEGVIFKTVAVLREFLARCEAALRSDAPAIAHPSPVSPDAAGKVKSGLVEGPSHPPR